MDEVAERLLALADALPAGGAVTLDRDALRRLAGVVVETAAEPDDLVVDLTVGEVGEALGRSASTVRGWCARGELPGSYRLNGREWRVPKASIGRWAGASRGSAGRSCLAESRWTWRGRVRTSVA